MRHIAPKHQQFSDLFRMRRVRPTPLYAQLTITVLFRASNCLRTFFFFVAVLPPLKKCVLCRLKTFFPAANFQCFFSTQKKLMWLNFWRTDVFQMRRILNESLWVSLSSCFSWSLVLIVFWRCIVHCTLLPARYSVKYGQKFHPGAACRQERGRFSFIGRGTKYGS